MLDKIDRDGIHARFPDMEFLTSVNDMGVVLDVNLDMDEQIGNTYRSCYYHLHQIRIIRHSPSDVVSRMAFTFTRLAILANINLLTDGVTQLRPPC